MPHRDPRYTTSFADFASGTNFLDRLQELTNQTCEADTIHEVADKWKAFAFSRFVFDSKTAARWKTAKADG